MTATIKKLNTPYLWKPESQDTNDSRMGKPCFISSKLPIKDKVLNLRTKDGTIIGKMGYFGPFEKGSRHYSGWKGGSGDKASKLAEKAIAKSGKPAVFVDLGEVWLRVDDPRKRQGGK